MNQNCQYLSRGYDHLGNLGAKLRILKGYATLGHELLQNADDAPGVTECRFDVRGDALIVENNGRFSDCGSVEAEECSWKGEPDRRYRCDFHRFKKVAGGDKRREQNTTGAFGIGFISVYQVTDLPQIISGRHWTLNELEEEGRRIEVCSGCDRCQADHEGTRFILPWARDPDSPLRKELRAEAVGKNIQEELLRELEVFLPAAMIFLKRIEKVEILRGGKMVRCIERIVEDDRILLTGASDEGDEIWHQFRGDFGDRAAELRNEHSEMIEEKRRSEVTIALSQDAIVQGLLCATLPTQQSTGLPFHINGDFFTSLDRKTVILEQDYQSEWNRAALECAAGVFGESLEAIRDSCDPKYLWSLIEKVKNASEGPDDSVFESFWKVLRAKAQEAAVVYTSEKKWRTASGVHFLQQDEDQVIPILESIGIEVVHPDLRVFQKILTGRDYIGVPTLALDSLVDGLMRAGLDREFPRGEWPDFLCDEESLERVWKLIDRIRGKRETGKTFQEGDLGRKVAKLSLVVRRDGCLCPCKNVFGPEDDETVALFHAFDSGISFADERCRSFETGLLLYQRFGPVPAIKQLEAIPAASYSTIFAGSKAEPNDLIAWFETYGVFFREDEPLARRLAQLPIYPSGGGFKPLTALSLPGDFEDPLKMADVLDVEVMPRHHDFLRDLGVQELSLQVCVKRHLIPALEDEDMSPKDRRAASLFLARKRSEISGVEGIQDALWSVSLVECGDEEFRASGECYLPDETVSEVLGPDVPTARIPAEHELILTEFLKWLGVADEPRRPDIMKRIKWLIEDPPKEESISAVQRVFEFLGRCINLGGETDKHDLDALRSLPWLPADTNDGEWHAPGKLHAGFQRHLFASQARFLAISLATQRKSKKFLEFLGIETSPDTDLVVSHLLNCANVREQVSREVYRHLNDNWEHSSIKRLRGQACLLLPDGTYVKPDMVFWSSHSFGRFRWHVNPEEGLRNYRKLFDGLGVKETPSWNDALSVLQEIGQDVGTANKIVDESLRGTVMACWQMLDRALLHEEAEDRDLAKLGEVKCVPNGQQLLMKPSLMFFEDRAGLAGKFDQFLEQHTIPRPVGACLAMQTAGVRPLVSAVEVDLLECEDPREDPDVSDRVRERMEALVRVLYAQDSPIVLQDQVKILKALRFERTDLLRISYRLKLFRETLSSEAENCPALFRQENNSVLFMCPGKKIPWTLLAREISRAVDPDYEASPAAAAINSVLAADSVEEALTILDELGFALLESREFSDGGSGQVLDALGGTTETAEGFEGEMPEALPQEDEQVEEDAESKVSGAQDDGYSEKPESRVREPRDTGGQDPSSGGSPGGGDERPRKRIKRRRGRLMSYVIPEGAEDPDEAEPDSDAEKARKEVEKAGVAKVVAYEKRLGRVPIVMPDGNEGYDIIIEDAEGNVLRYVEVKSRSAEWDQMGVGLTSPEFEKARAEREKYWLYVAEKALDDESRIHRIQDPASKVDRYHFDDGWRSVAEPDGED